MSLDYGSQVAQSGSLIFFGSRAARPRLKTTVSSELPQSSSIPARPSTFVSGGSRFITVIFYLIRSHISQLDLTMASTKAARIGEE